jgi:hypothetical protein
MTEKMSGSEPEPSPATVNGVARASLQVFTFDACQVAQTLTSLVPLPIQANLRASKLAPPAPISGSIAMPRANTPSVAPSFGAAL